jgi:hypothetical protein
VNRKFRHFAAQIGTHRLRKSIRDGYIIFFQLPQADQRFLEIVVSEVLSPGRELLESAMRCAGGLRKRIVKLPHCIGEEFSGLGTAHEGSAGRPAKDGTDNVPNGLGIDPALLQNLARQLFDAFSDRLVFDRGRRGVCRRGGRIRHVMLLGCCWSLA